MPEEPTAIAGSGPPPPVDDHDTAVRGAIDLSLSSTGTQNAVTEESPFERRLAEYTRVGSPGRTQETKMVAGRYRLLKPIGHGSMGHIFLAEQVSVGRRVAIKIINRELTAKFDTIARFQQEARLLASVHNEHIVDIYDIGETESGDPFIAMEFVEGASLASIIHDDAPLTAVRSIRLLLQVANALASVHGAGVVHRDLKPANMVILTRKDGFEIVKILDFGLAKVISDREATVRLTRAGVIIGTPEYMSPEQVTATGVDHRADLYSFGCTAYEMLCGHPPFVGPEMSTLYKHMHEEVPSLLSTDEPVAESLAKVVMRCLAKDPGKRYQSAGELHTALLVAADEAGIQRRELRIPRTNLEDAVDPPQLPPATTTASMSIVAPPPTRRRGVETLLIALIALVFGTVAGVLVAQRSSDRAPASVASTTDPSAAVAVVTKGALVVRTEPPGAEVTLDGQKPVTSPAVFAELAVGKHQLSVHKRGFVQIDRQIDVGAGAVVDVPLALSHPRYTMNVETDPPGATVTIDGTELGATPVMTPITEHEFHELSLRREGYATRTIFIAPETRQETLQITLDPALLSSGSIVVDSEHPGRVLIDGRETGEWTPTGELPLAPGRHEIVLIDGAGVQRKLSVKVIEGDLINVTVP